MVHVVYSMHFSYYDVDVACCNCGVVRKFSEGSSLLAAPIFM